MEFNNVKLETSRNHLSIVGYLWRGVSPYKNHVNLWTKRYASRQVQRTYNYGGRGGGGLGARSSLRYARQEL